MSDTDNFFEGSVRSSAPSLKLSAINDGVKGVIVDQFKVEKKKFGSDEVEKDIKTGEPIIQLVVVLQTDLRNWAQVAKVPRVDPTDRNSPEKDPSEDDGRRSVYVAPWTNLHAAIGKATAAHNGGKPTGLKSGATLGVKVIDLEDTGKGNPKKVHAAVYEPPSGSSDFFGEQQTQGGSGDAAATPPAQEPAAQAPAQADPWGGQAQTQAPPF